MTKQIYFTRINFAKILEKCVKYSYILDRIVYLILLFREGTSSSLKKRYDYSGGIPGF